MKYPGQPVSSPSWYRDRGPSYIEKQFSKELNELADEIEKEVWFGDKEKHDRYRVDFILKDARLIIELDGHEYHSTKEQLERDAIRQRYLTRAGFSIIRFTGGEIVKGAKACVEEVRTIYKERMQRAPAKYRVMYIDSPFLYREMSKALKFYRDYHPDKELTSKPLEQVIPHAIEWLYEKSFVTVFVFYPPEDENELKYLDGKIQEYAKGEMRINTVADEWYSLELGNHLANYSHLFDDFMLVADDPVYIAPFQSILPKETSKGVIGPYSFDYYSNAKILRKNNDETAFAGTELAKVRWQNIWYIIGVSLGLELHEL